MIIVVSGTPGTGKTSVSERLAEEINGIHIDLTRMTMEEGLYTRYDEARQTYVIDEEKVTRRIMSLIENKGGPIIIDTHYPEIIPPIIVDRVFILRLHPRILEERLRRRGWPWRKIAENVMAEILGIVAANAFEVFGEDKVCMVDTTGLSVSEIVGKILTIIRGNEGNLCNENIDWLTEISPEELERYGEY